MRKRAFLSRSIAIVSSLVIVVAITSSCGSGILVATGDGGTGEGGTSGEGGGGGGDSSLLRDAMLDAPPLADAPFACGAQSCRVDQYCLQPCCGGAAPACERKNDAGGCPAGFHAGFCNQFGSEGCVMDPCTPPPASCIDDPQTAGFGCQQRGSSRVLTCQCA